MDGIHVGYAEGNAYRIFVPHLNRVIISRDLTFFEKLHRPIYSDAYAMKETALENTLDFYDSVAGTEVLTDTDTGVEIDLASPNVPSSTSSSIPNETETSDEELPAYRTRAGRQIRKSSGIFALAFLTARHIESTTLNDFPESIDEAVSSERMSDWIDAAKKELISITLMGTYEITNRPQGRNKIVRNKRVFALKKDEHRNIVRYEARLVAKGFTQTQGVDYSEVFAPVLRFKTVRFLLAICASRN